MVDAKLVLELQGVRLAEGGVFGPSWPSKLRTNLNGGLLPNLNDGTICYVFAFPKDHLFPDNQPG